MLEGLAIVVVVVVGVVEQWETALMERKEEKEKEMGIWVWVYEEMIVVDLRMASVWGCSCGGSTRERVVGATCGGVIRRAEAPGGGLGQARGRVAS
jgi:hypothetical protein